MVKELAPILNHLVVAEDVDKWVRKTGLDHESGTLFGLLGFWAFGLLAQIAQTHLRPP